MNLAIELFRGVAAWMVFTAHYVLAMGMERTFFHFLWTGVDFFFVISGFVFGRLIYNGHHHLIGYLIRRFFRIYPLYFCSLWLYYLISPVHPEKLSFLANHLLFLQTTHSLEEAYFFNPAYWSLPVEIEFYLAVPLLVFFTAQYIHFPFIISMLCILWMPLIAALATNLTQPNFYTIIQFHLPHILIEFMVGVLLFKFYTESKTYFESKTKRSYVLLSVLLLIALILLNYLATFFVLQGDEGIQYNLFFKSYFSLFCAIGYALLLFPFLFMIKEKNGLLAVFCKWMGNISYGAYLFHHFVLILLKETSVQQNSLFIYLGYSFIVIMIALLFHHLIENPLRIFGKKLSYQVSVKS